MKSFFVILATLAVAMAACPTGQQLCNTQCYNPSSNTCGTDQYTGKPFLCGLNYAPCNGACFLPTQYHCDSTGRLQPGGAATKANTKSTTSPVVSSTKSTTSPVVTSTTTVQATLKSTTQAAQSCNPSGCGTGLCNCNGACFSPSSYCCLNNVLTQISFCPKSATSSASSTQAAAATTSTPAPVVNPTPVPGQYPTQTADLRIINSCKTTLWFEARYGNQGAPLPGATATAVIAPPGSYVDYVIPDTGLSGTRFWAKYGCDSYGKNCVIGDQMQYWPNPPGGCPSTGCTPPVDSLFEATWGCRPGSSCNAANPTTWFDTSQVDGWTIPYKLTPIGDTSKCDCIGNQCGFSGVDASTLDLARCPKNENLVAGGQTTANVLGKSVDLSSVDLRIIKNNQVVGCMSPCKRLNWGTPFGLGQPESSGSTMWMCCPTPTPNDCSPANGCVAPLQCRTGPIENTQFVAAVHAMAPGVYSYSYDDGVGLHACPAGVTKYTMEFCPTGSATYPLQL